MYLLGTATIVKDFHNDLPISLDRSSRQLAEGIGYKSRRLRMHPVIGGHKNLMLSAHDKVGHMPSNVWYSTDDSKGAYAVTAGERW